MNTLGKSPSPMRVGVIAGAAAVLAVAMTPASAASGRPKETPAKKVTKAVPPPARPTNSGGGRAGPFSIEWRALENFSAVKLSIFEGKSNA